MDFSFVSSSQPLKRKAPSDNSVNNNNVALPTSAPAPASSQPTGSRVGGTRNVTPQAALASNGSVRVGVAAPIAQLPVQQNQPATVQPHAQYGARSQSAAAADQANFNPNAIVVNRRQQGNPLLSHIRNVRWQFGDIVPDYQMGATACALFLSLRFHLLKPEYVHHRIKQLQRAFRLRVILCLVDIEDVVDALNQVTRAALLNECTLICAFSAQECARYLETFKSFESKSADNIQGRTEEDFLSRLNAAVTAVRGVNKTNVLTLGRAFGSAAGIMQASMEELSACPGIGPTKVRRLYDTFHEPFRRTLQREPEIQQSADQTAGQTAEGKAVPNANDLNEDALLFD